MSLRILAAVLFASSALACIPKESDPNVSDLDGDGIVDARDRCMADPEDFDGYEDEDGCAELEGPDRSEATAKAMEPALKVRRKKIENLPAKPLKSKESKARVTKYQGTAWGAMVDSAERSVIVFGFGKLWVKAGGKSKLVKDNAYRGSFSPDGKHVALVTDRSFLILDARSGKRLSRFSFAPGTEDAMETKLIHLGDNGEVLFFDGCELQRGTVGSEEVTAIGPAQCGSRPLMSQNGEVWFTWLQAEEQITVHEINANSGERRAVLGGEGDAPGLSVILNSPDGKHLCYSRHKDGSEFTCRNLSTLEDQLVWQGATDERLAFTEDGLLGFGAGPRREKRDFYVANLGASTLTKVGSLGAKEKWLTAVDGGFVASGGSRLRHFDLAKGIQLDIALGDGEWEGFAAIPGRASEFLVGKERRATRDVFRVVVP
tara:strand:+ start:65329 stop:66621 length:1293 start_codon:yes stop_codon:yes gene_type:complete